MQATIEQLKDLRLTGLLEAWREQQTQPCYHDLSFDERLALLVEREYLQRQNRRLSRRLKLAHLPLQTVLEQVDFDVPRGLPKAQFLQLAQGRWVQEHLHLLLVGPTGVGKTFLASVLAERLCQQQVSVRYFKTAELLWELKLAKADGSFGKWRQQLAAFPLLILDEWLRDPLSVNDAREMLDLLDERYRRTSCLFATQLPVEQWHQQIQDPTLADAILDRVVHDSLRLCLSGESMRKLTSPLQPSKENAASCVN